VKYELKLPDASTLDPAALERAVAIARERSLTPEQAQAALELANTEAKAAVAKANADFLAAYQPGDPEKGIAPGAEWTKQHDAWLSQSLADPDLGAGKVEQLNAKVALASQAFERFASPAFRALLSEKGTGYGSHPEVIRTFAAIGAAMAEQPFVTPGTDTPADDREKLYRMYPSMRPKE
jgi:hypothetical protein